MRTARVRIVGALMLLAGCGGVTRRASDGGTDAGSGSEVAAAGAGGAGAGGAGTAGGGAGAGGTAGQAVDAAADVAAATDASVPVVDASNDALGDGPALETPEDADLVPPSDGGQIPPDQIVDQLHTVECQRQVNCGLQPTLADCVASTKPPISARIQADIVSGKIIYDPFAGKALVDWMSTLPCSLSVVNNTTTALALKSHCGAAIHGTVPLDESCAADDECAAGLVCSTIVRGLPYQPPHCAPAPPTPQIGDFCDTGCDPASSYCDTLRDPGKPTCEPKPTMVGQACEGPCGNNLLCTASGTCGTLPRLGEACDSTMNFYRPVCDDPRQYCAPRSDTCQPLLGLGVPCEQGFDACAPTLYCDWTSMTCAARLPLGADCTGLKGEGELCLGDMACDATPKCTLDADLGGSLFVCP